MRRNFKYRIRSNFGNFLLTLALYSVAFVVFFFVRTRHTEKYLFSNTIENFSGHVISIIEIRDFFTDPIPFIIIFSFFFYFFFCKRFTVRQEYRLGFSRNDSYAATLIAAVWYALFLSMYMVSFAVLFRNIYLSTGNRIVFSDFYIIEMRTFLGYAFVGFCLCMLAFGLINTFRNLRLAKFWIGEAVCLGVFVTLCFTAGDILRTQDRLREYLLVLVPTVLLYMMFDFVLSRGKQR